MTTWRLLTTTWNWDPSVLLGCAALLAGYALFIHPRHRAQDLSFASGVFVLLIALESPLDLLGDEYLFSAHMLQHLLLILVVPPLILLGVRDELLRQSAGHPWLGQWERSLSYPILAWLFGEFTLWIWHLPILYDATLVNENVHVVEHLLFLVTATIFWWPIIRNPKEGRLSPEGAIFYLMAGGFANTLLGILVAFSPGILYSPYLNPPDSLGIASLIRNSWGLSAGDDQQIAGLMMWIPGSFAYLLATLFEFIRLADSEKDEERRAAELEKRRAQGLALKEHS